MQSGCRSVGDVSQKLAITKLTWLRWKNQYGGMQSEIARRLRELELEDRRLKELLTEAELDRKILKTAAEGNF